MKRSVYFEWPLLTAEEQPAHTWPAASQKAKVRLAALPRGRQVLMGNKTRRPGYFQMVNMMRIAVSLLLALGLHCTNASANTPASGYAVSSVTANAVNSAGQMVAFNSSPTQHEQDKDGETDDKDNDKDEGNVPVPEPGAILLLSAGLFGLAIYGKRNEEKEVSSHK